LTSWLAVSVFLFIMHPSSFYDLQACYIYTALYGPYSLSEALEGLLFYPLEECSIGSNRTLQHELVSELSNVINDLQDYLIYFSSQFLISPSDSPDLIKELQSSCSKFEHLNVCWGALIMHLVIAHKIVELNFWPHLFQPAINNLTAFQRLKQHPPSTLPNVLLNKTSASTFISSPQTNSPSNTINSLLESQCLLLNVQSEHPQTTPSGADPMVGKEDHTPFSRLDMTPMPPRLHCIQIPSNHQLSDTSLGSCLPQKLENHPNKVFVLIDDTIAARHFCSSTVPHCNKNMGCYPSSILFTFHHLAFASHDSFPYLSVGSHVTINLLTPLPPLHLLLSGHIVSQLISIGK